MKHPINLNTKNNNQTLSLLFLKYLVISLCLFITSAIQAQDDCATTLSKAQKLYDAGSIEQIPQILAPCLADGFTSEEKVQAQKLIILSSLFNNNKTEAEAEMLEFLKKNPEYRLASNDPAEFVGLYNEFITEPIAAVGIILGLNIPKVGVIKRYGVYNLNANKGTYSATLGFSAGLAYNQNIKKNIDLDIELCYSQYGFEYSLDNLYGFANILTTESYSQIRMPITGAYKFSGYKNFTPFLRAGFAPILLIQTTQVTERSYSDNTSKPLTSPSSNVLNNRNSFLIDGIIGAGVEYRIPRGIIYIDARYNIGFMNVVKPSTQYSNLDNQLTYFNSDNEFRISNWQFSVGYFYTLFKPRKK